MLYFRQGKGRASVFPLQKDDLENTDDDEQEEVEQRCFRWRHSLATLSWAAWAYSASGNKTVPCYVSISYINFHVHVLFIRQQILGFDTGTWHLNYTSQAVTLYPDLADIQIPCRYDRSAHTSVVTTTSAPAAWFGGPEQLKSTLSDDCEEDAEAESELFGNRLPKARLRRQWAVKLDNAEMRHYYNKWCSDEASNVRMCHAW